MKYVSIDIETLGLNIDAPIVEVACVFVDNGKILGQEQTYVCHDKYDNCEPFAMAMHPDTLRLIAGGPCDGVCHIRDLDLVINGWLGKYAFDDQVTYAGKNAAGFDLPMLERQCHAFKELCNPHHRVLDPGPMFSRRGMKSTPTLNAIIEQEGLDAQVTHTALDDALAVVAAIERFFNLQEEAANNQYLLDDLRD